MKIDNTDSAYANQQLKGFRLRDLIKPDVWSWSFSWVLGLVTALSIIGLLLVSGWFLTITAFVGALSLQGFNYRVPSMLIRIFALSRTLGRYAEMVFSHNAIFRLLRDLRVQFFHTLAQRPLTSQHSSVSSGHVTSGQSMHRLVSDINILNEFNLRIIMPWLTAIIITVSISLAIIFFVPLFELLLTATTEIFPSFIHSASNAPNVSSAEIVSSIHALQTSASSFFYTGLFAVPFLLICAVVLPTVMAYRSQFNHQPLAHINEKRKDALLAPLSIITQLLMWQQWQTKTQEFVIYDKQLQHINYQLNKQKNIVIMIMQWLVSAMILIVLCMVVNTGITLDSSEDMLATKFYLPIILAVVLGLLALQEVLLPLAQHYVSYGKAKLAKQGLNELLSGSNDSNESNESAFSSELIHDSRSEPLRALPSENLTMELKSVSAKMPNAIVGADNVCATARAGVPLIISGVSGCGKSTLLQTLANELVPQSGEILLNGQAWHDYNWADQLGYLGQQLDIFDQTLADNLRLGNPNARDEELLAVLDTVALLDWIQAQPQGLHTQLGEYGTAVSGGQARRIALARLLLKPRAVLLLDEPFAGLDKVAQAQLWQAITKHQKNALLIVVSHHQDWEGIGEVDRLRLG